MSTLRARFRIVTPAFVGDAAQKPTSIRPPSIKGALRFWWRALAWGQALAAHPHSHPEALRSLHAREAELFGLAASGETGGQGRFLLRVTGTPRHPPMVSDWPVARTPSAYLGLGLFRLGDFHGRSAIQETTEFTLELSFRSGASPADVDELRRTLTAWGLLGGLGARARRGFGSVQLIDLDGQSFLGSKDAYQRRVEDLLKDQAQSAPGYPPFSALCEHSRFKIMTEGASARAAHARLGERFYDHRGQPSTLRGSTKIPFGLPLKGVDEKNRRSSPLLFHVHEVEDDKPRRFVTAALFLPATFHPKIHSPDLGAFYADVERFLLEESQP